MVLVDGFTAVLLVSGLAGGGWGIRHFSERPLNTHKHTQARWVVVAYLWPKYLPCRRKQHLPNAYQRCCTEGCSVFVLAADKDRCTDSGFADECCCVKEWRVKSDQRQHRDLSTPHRTMHHGKITSSNLVGNLCSMHVMHANRAVAMYAVCTVMHATRTMWSLLVSSQRKIDFADV